MQPILKSESTAARRRVYFVAVDTLSVQTRITSAQAGTFVVYVSKNGSTPSLSSATVHEVDATNMPGSHYVELPAGDVDTNGILLIRITSTGGSKTMEPREKDCLIWEVSGFDSVRGLAGTALPNAAAEAAGGLFTRGTGAGQINQAANGQIDCKVVAGSFLTDLERIKGLLHANAMVDNYVYGAQGIVTSARLRVFADATAAGGAVAGHANDADSEAYRYSIDAVDAGSGEMTYYRITQTK